MIFLFHRQFRKRYKKLHQKTKARFEERLKLFENDQFHPLLENHALRGVWKEYRSINVTGDIRAIYKAIDARKIEFVLIGTHHELYGK